MAKRLKTIDLFAGCGGMTAGFKPHGFDPVLSVELNLHAAATYAANFGERHTFWGDIDDALKGDIPDADVVIGGPPCQGFSNLGSRDVNDPRNKLWKRYLEVVERANPKVFVIENVERFKSSAEYQLLIDEAKNGLISDYELSPGVLLAADYGVGQRRPRTIIIGSRVGKIDLPKATHAKVPTGNLKPWVTVRDRIGALPLHPTTTTMPDTSATFFGQTVPGRFKSADLHFGRNPRELSLLRYDCIPPGGGRFDLPDELLPDCWRNKTSGTTDVMGRMRWDAPSLTIRTEFFKPEKGQYLHPQWDPKNSKKRVNRVITHLEAARLQDFPEWFEWCGSKTEIAKQIGNAVPVGLASAVAEQIKEALS
ncbi:MULTISPECIES: DNA cytosine methyltransferase [unclassified Mycobacterium]|uniref:DNA cytosine methyltransferase n=1 Tax=unclassified Mycobacterium TaxID=2642494 RepID=UPI0009E8D99A|nr:MULTISPECIES: DNA cytosine methyltransferase [unclassified Mycobacterium]